MCKARVRCGQGDLGVTPVPLPCYSRVSQVGGTRETLPECMDIFHIHSGNFGRVTVWSGVS